VKQTSRAFTPSATPGITKASFGSDSSGGKNTGNFGSTLESGAANYNPDLINEPVDQNNQNDDPKFKIINYGKVNEPDNSSIEIGPMNTIYAYDPQKIHLRLSKKELSQNFAYYMLPNDYPHSVNNGYSRFSCLFAVSAFSITLMSFISTQALFVALGSTTTKASLYSAAYTWVLKDGIGQLGAIIFAGKFGKSFDQDVKKWRFMCMLVMNLAIIVEM
jgi:hypothetical protein